MRYGQTGESLVTQYKIVRLATRDTNDMAEQFWTTVFAIGVVQGVFAVSNLVFQRRTNRRASRYLALIVAAHTAMILCEALERALDPAIAQLLTFLNINTELIIGPLVFLFVRSISSPDHAFRGRDARHFLPFLVCLAGWLVMWAQIRHVPGGGLHSVPLLPHFVATKACFFFLYIVAAYQLLRPASPDVRDPRKAVTSMRLSATDWLRHGLVISSAGAGIIYAVAILDTLKIDTVVEPDLFGSVLLASFIFLASLILIARPSLLSARRATQTHGDPYDYVARLISSMEDDRLWLNPEFGLGDLAKKMDMGENRVSALINQELGTSFYGLLNSYRLHEFERLASSPEYQSKSVLDIAFASGFGSKASFYRVFRETKEMTPTEYRRICLENRPSNASQWAL